jgi:hypothetical protein
MPSSVGSTPLAAAAATATNFKGAMGYVAELLATTAGTCNIGWPKTAMRDSARCPSDSAD